MLALRQYSAPTPTEGRRDEIESRVRRSRDAKVGLQQMGFGHQPKRASVATMASEDDQCGERRGLDRRRRIPHPSVSRRRHICQVGTTTTTRKEGVRNGVVSEESQEAEASSLR